MLGTTALDQTYARFGVRTTFVCSRCQMEQTLAPRRGVSQIILIVTHSEAAMADTRFRCMIGGRTSTQRIFGRRFLRIWARLMARGSPPKMYSMRFSVYCPRPRTLSVLRKTLRTSFPMFPFPLGTRYFKMPYASAGRLGRLKRSRASRVRPIVDLPSRASRRSRAARSHQSNMLMAQSRCAMTEPAESRDYRNRCGIFRLAATAWCRAGSNLGSAWRQTSLSCANCAISVGELRS